MKTTRQKEDPEKNDQERSNDVGGTENGDARGPSLRSFRLGTGYFWKFLYAIESSVVLPAMIVCAVILCASYILASCILWGLGMYVLLASPWAERKGQDSERMGEGAQDSQALKGMPDPMPGQEMGCHWERAWELATLRNNGVQRDFHVGLFLKSKTGLDKQQLALLIKDRDATTKFEGELVEVRPASLPRSHSCACVQRVN